MTPELRAVLDQSAADKDITRINGRFIVMSFAEREQADEVAAAVVEAVEGATVEVTMIEVEVAPEAAE